MHAYMCIYLCMDIYLGIQGSLNKFADFFRMDTFIDSTHMKVLLCEHVNDLRHSLFHILNRLITTASKLRE